MKEEFTTEYPVVFHSFGYTLPTMFQVKSQDGNISATYSLLKCNVDDICKKLKEVMIQFGYIHSSDEEVLVYSMPEIYFDLIQRTLYTTKTLLQMFKENGVNIVKIPSITDGTGTITIKEK